MILLRRRTMLRGAALAGLAGVATATWRGRAMAAADETIKLGAPFNLTGNMASLDQPALNGAKLAAQEINATGGVLGRKIELVVYDTKSDPTVAASVGSQLLNQDKVLAAFGFTDSDYALAIGTLFQKAAVPFLTPGATSPKLPEQIGDEMFLVCFGDNVQAAAGAEFTLNTLKAKNVYLLRDSSTEYTTLLAKYFEEALVHGGGKVVKRDDYKSGDRSFSAQITKLKALSPKPQALFVSAGPDDIGLVVKQLRQAGVTLPIVGGDGYDTPLLLSVGGKGAHDVYYSTHAYMAEDSTPDIKKFYAAYKAAFNTPPENAFAALGYDTVELIVDAIKRAGVAEPAKLRDALATTQGYHGITGAISYRPGVRVPDKTVTIIGAGNNRLHLAAQVTPSWVAQP